MIRLLFKFIFILLLTNLEMAFAQPKSETDVLSNWKRTHFVAYCNIFDFEGKLILEVPGNICYFMPDGHLVSGNTSGLTLYNPDKSKAWEILGHFHHQLTLSNDGKFILAISSKVLNKDGKKIRYDVLYKVDMKGNIVGTIDTIKIFEAMKFEFTITPFTWDPAYKDADHELSHINSFYEVPKQNSPEKSALKEGQFVVNSISAGSFLLDAKLEKAIMHFPFKTSLNVTHDVQPQPDGTLLYINNLVLQKNVTEPYQAPFSNVETYDPKLKEAKVIFQAEPPQAFFSKACGGVQKLTDSVILISHMFMGSYIYDTKQKRILKTTLLDIPNSNGALRAVQNAKLVNLESFLSHWKSN